MKSVLLFCTLTAAHSAVNYIKFDGTTYPARFGLIDSAVSAKRIEWASSSSSLWGYQPITEVNDPAITCQNDPKPPALKAVARAGSDVEIMWSPIVRGHLGPVMTWMGRWEANQAPQQVKFFKIAERVYNKETKLWGNEELMLANNTDFVKIPSDIEPGTYIFRTELLALHANNPSMNTTALGGPQFYPHCFNVEILGNGVAPGPTVYNGKHDSPVGPVPVVKETGFYPEARQKQYEDLRFRLQEVSSAIVDLVNAFDYGNSRTSAPSTAETLKLLGRLGADVTKAPALIQDINKFNKGSK